MSDTEMLNLIEHYKWDISFEGSFIKIKGANGIFHLSFQGKDLRAAIKSAMDMQRIWSVGA